MVIALACAGCTNPDDILAVSGTVESVDPVEGQVVRLLRQLTRDQVGSPFVFFGDPCALAGDPFKDTPTSRAGEFGFEVFRAETRPTSGIGSACFRSEVTFPSGSVAWSDFFFSRSNSTLAPLRDWRAMPWIDGGVLHFEPPIPWPGDLPPVRMGIYVYQGLQLTHREQLVTADGGIAWDADDRSRVPNTDFEFARESLQMDEFRLEDFEGTLTLTASIWDPDQDSTFDNPGGVPPSFLKAGQQLTLRGTRVPLTDGDLTGVDAGSITEVPFRLATPSMVSAIVLRGAWVGNGLIRVLLAPEDGGTATEVEHTVPRSYSQGFRTSDPPRQFLRDGGYVNFVHGYVVIPVDAGTPSSQVTLQFPEGLARIQEISVFE